MSKDENNVLPIKPPDLPSNSIVDMSPAEPRPDRPRNKIRAKRVKKTLGQRITSFFVTDNSKGVLDYIITDIVVTGIKEMVLQAAEDSFQAVADAFKDSISYALFGEETDIPTRSRGGKSTGSRVYVDYGSRSSRGSRGGKASGKSRTGGRRRSKYDFTDLRAETKAEAIEVLQNLRDDIDEYDEISVADFYYYMDIPDRPTDHEWGWYDLNSAEIIRTRNGEYMFKMPPVVWLER